MGAPPGPPLGSGQSGQEPRGQEPQDRQPYGQQPPAQQPPAQQPPAQQPPAQQPYGPPPYGPPLAAPPAKVRPGRIWYLVPLLVFLGGMAWLVIGLLSIGSQIDSFQRVPLPAGGQISLDHPGGYVIYYEGPGAHSGNIPSFRIRVVPVAAPAAVQSLSPYNASVTYEYGSHQGRAVLNMQISHGGRFAIVIPGSPALPAGSQLAFGSGVVGGIIGVALPSALLIILGLAGLAVLLIIRVVQTSRARTAVRAASQPGGPPIPPST